MEIETVKKLVNKMENKITLNNGKILILLHKITIADLDGIKEEISYDQDKNLTNGLSIVSVDPISYLLVSNDEIQEYKVNGADGTGKWMEFIKSGINVLKKK